MAKTRRARDYEALLNALPLIEAFVASHAQPD
jgi:hypothetical protein